MEMKHFGAGVATQKIATVVANGAPVLIRIELKIKKKNTRIETKREGVDSLSHLLIYLQFIDNYTADSKRIRFRLVQFVMKQLMGFMLEFVDFTRIFREKTTDAVPTYYTYRSFLRVFFIQILFVIVRGAAWLLGINILANSRFEATGLWE